MTFQAHLTQLPHCAFKQVKNIIAIASGKGGVGKSTVASNLAVALAQKGVRTGLLDADIYGPSIPIMMGASHGAEIHEGRAAPVMLHGVQTMSIALMTGVEQALIWRGPMLAKTLIQLLDRTAWDNLDCLIIDLPPGTGDIQLSLVQKIPLAGAIVVTTPQTVATRDADKAIQLFEKTQVPLLGLVENMAMHICEQCGHQSHLFGQGGAKQLSEAHHIPFLGQLPLDEAIQLSGDKGKPSALDPRLETHWEKLAQNVMNELKSRPITSIEN